MRAGGSCGAGGRRLVASSPCAVGGNNNMPSCTAMAARGSSRRSGSRQPTTPHPHTEEDGGGAAAAASASSSMIVPVFSLLLTAASFSRGRRASLHARAGSSSRATGLCVQHSARLLGQVVRQKRVWIEEEGPFSTPKAGTIRLRPAPARRWRCGLGQLPFPSSGGCAICNDTPPSPLHGCLTPTCASLQDGGVAISQLRCRLQRPAVLTRQAVAVRAQAGERSRRKDMLP